MNVPYSNNNSSTGVMLLVVVTQADGISRRKDRGRRVYSSKICFLKTRKYYIDLKHNEEKEGQRTGLLNSNKLY